VPKLIAFDKIFSRAAKRKGSAAKLEAMLPAPPKSNRALSRIADDRWLSRMTQGVFSAGFVWKVVENKWPGFEKAFHGFEIPWCAMLDESELDALMGDTRIIRNRPKVLAVRDNARMIATITEEHGSFGRFVSRWPSEDIVGLWDVLKKRGSRLGGMTGPYMLRAMGKDSFMLTSSVEKALLHDKVIDGPPTSKARLAVVQSAFNAWAKETGRPLAQLSGILAYSVP